MKISEMQHKLAKWAQDDSKRRFDRLLRLIADRTWLAEAARLVLASRDAKTPGMDNMRGDYFQQHKDEILERLRQSLLDGTYIPAPARRTDETPMAQPPLM